MKQDHLIIFKSFKVLNLHIGTQILLNIEIFFEIVSLRLDALFRKLIQRTT
jgi:hypothetical protein